MRWPLSPAGGDTRVRGVALGGGFSRGGAGEGLVWKHVGGGSQQQTGWAVVSTDKPSSPGMAPGPSGWLVGAPAWEKGKMGTERHSLALKPACKMVPEPAAPQEQHG